MPANLRMGTVTGSTSPTNAAYVHCKHSVDHPLIHNTFQHTGGCTLHHAQQWAGTHMR
jgi:hypothetical protein